MKKKKKTDNRIVELMRKRGLSYRALEQLSGVQYPTIYKVANYTFSSARLNTLTAIAHGLGVSVEELFLKEDIENDE